MWASRYFLLFNLYAFLGWVYETAYRTVKDGKWQNRGFLFGPICPIYGVGAVAVTVILEFCPPPVDGAAMPVWGVFLISMLGSAVLEYATSWALERLFHAVWWDYSRLPLNIHGRVSLFTSCFFGAAGVLVVYVLAPLAEDAVGWLPPIWTEILSLVLMAVLAADTTLTVSALTDFAQRVRAVDTSINAHMDTFVEHAVQRASGAKNQLTEGRDRIAEQLSSMRRATGAALHRIRAFRFERIEDEKLKAALREWRERAGRR